MNNNAKRNLGILAVGLAAGAVAGVLLAPKSGRELRQDIRRQADGIGGRGAGYWRRLRNRRRQTTPPSLWEAEGVLATNEIDGPYPHS